MLVELIVTLLCFSIQVILVFLCTDKTQKVRGKFIPDKNTDKTQKGLDKIISTLLKILRNNSLSIMWFSCNFNTPVAGNRCGLYSNHTCNQLKLRNGGLNFSVLSQWAWKMNIKKLLGWFEKRKCGKTCNSLMKTWDWSLLKNVANHSPETKVSFLVNDIMAQFTEKEIGSSKKIKLFLESNMAEFQLCFAAFSTAFFSSWKLMITKNVLGHLPVWQRFISTRGHRSSS